MGNTKHNYRISSDVKEQVLKRIKEEGISVAYILPTSATLG